MAKRVFDITLSGLILVILCPIVPLLLFALKITGEGEIFFVQPRIGKKGVIFGLYKFATMLKDSPNLPGGDITVNNDPRLLPLGKILRKTKINELPQLWNVIKGDMSLVGPRPLTPRNFNMYPVKIREEIKAIQPGITGVGSIVFRDEESIIKRSEKSTSVCYLEDIAPYKGELELWYKKNLSFGLDLKLLFLTAWAILFPGSSIYEKLLPDLPDKPECLR
jgi:lipopolysaccharide/colanic/teichoic acid biosynthesis glycosyltransferase